MSNYPTLVQTVLDTHSLGSSPSSTGNCEVVGVVDRLDELFDRDGAVGAQGVPAVVADVAHDGGVVRVAIQPLVGLVAGRAARDCESAAAEEGEDLAPTARSDLGHVVVLTPRAVGPRAGLGQAVLTLSTTGEN